MASLNKIFLIGNLTRDPLLKYAPSGTAIGTFGMATNREFTTQTGEKKQETCFVNIVVWGKQAEACSKYLSKGRLIFVEGRLQYRAWEGPNGEKRSALEVRADRIQFLDRARSQAQQGEVPGQDKAVNINSGLKNASEETFLPEEDLTIDDERDLSKE